MATVVYFDSAGDPQFLCSGTLVSSNVVLTAGHCGANETTGVPNSPSGYRIVTNAADWTDTTTRVISDVSQVDVDPSFDPTTVLADASMLVLSSPVSSPAIPLWSTGQLNGGTAAQIAGWGKTDVNQTSWPTILQSAPTVLQSTGLCSQRAAMMGYDYDPSSELCAVDAPSDTTATCNGDSGGPLLTQDAGGSVMEIGITSVGPADCDTDTADFFTSVLPIAPWIEAEIDAVNPAAAAPSATTTPSATTAPSAPPRSVLPRMSQRFARSHTRDVLAGVFHRTFTHGSSYSVSCTRTARSRFHCRAHFSSGPDDYDGDVIIRYLFDAKGVVDWSDTYTMRWVKAGCPFAARHRSGCRISVRRGVF